MGREGTKTIEQATTHQTHDQLNEERYTTRVSKEIKLEGERTWHMFSLVKKSCPLPSHSHVLYVQLLSKRIRCPLLTVSK